MGHSLGAAIALGAVAGVARGEATLVTVGQSIPLVSLQREAGWAREALDGLRVPWIDISAGRDVLGFDGVDPSQGRAVCYPARLSRSIPAERLKHLRWRGYATHLLYSAAAQKGDAPWDWFAVLTGAQNVVERMERETPKSGMGGGVLWFEGQAIGRQVPDGCQTNGRHPAPANISPCRAPASLRASECRSCRCGCLSLPIGRGRAAWSSRCRRSPARRAPGSGGPVRLGGRARGR